MRKLRNGRPAGNVRCACAGLEDLVEDANQICGRLFVTAEQARRAGDAGEGIAELLVDGLREPCGISRGNEFALSCRGYLGNAADLAGDERDAASHRLQQHARHSLGATGQDEQVGRTEPVRQLGMGPRTYERDAFSKPQPGQLSGEHLSERTLTDQPALEADARPYQPAQGFQKHIQPLDRQQIADEENQRCRFDQAEPASCLFAGTGMEPLPVHAVVHHPHAFGRDTTLIDMVGEVLAHCDDLLGLEQSFARLL